MAFGQFVLFIHHVCILLLCNDSILFYSQMCTLQSRIVLKALYYFITMAIHYRCVLFISYYVCLTCRGMVVTNVVRTRDPTPLL